MFLQRYSFSCFVQSFDINPFCHADKVGCEVQIYFVGGET